MRARHVDRALLAERPVGFLHPLQCQWHGEQFLDIALGEVARHSFKSKGVTL
jgi:hypothetical protein